MYVLPSFTEWYTTITSFDLWTNKGAHDVFVLVVKFKDRIGDWNI